MSLKITPEIFKWLQSISLVKQAKRNNDYLQLPQQLSLKYFDGITIAFLIKTSLHHIIDQQTLKKLQNIKQNSNPAIRLYNWNILIQILKKYKIVAVDNTQKSKIVNLEYEPVLKVLKGIYDNRQKQLKQQKKGLKIDINQIQKKTVQQTNNTMEFLVILLSKNFKLSHQHTLNLFIDNNKYLSHLLVKGVKNNYQPIYQFLNDIKINSDYLVSHLFCVDEEENVNFFYNALKSCLISKDSHTISEVIDLWLEIYMIYKIKNIQTKYLKKWVKTEGINSIFFTLTKNSQFFQKIIELTYNYLDVQLFEFFQFSQKNLLWSNDKQKLNIFRKIITLQNKEIVTNFLSSTTSPNYIDEWLRYFIKNHKKLKQNEQLYDMNLIFENLWLIMEDKFQDQALNLVNSYVQFLKQLLSMPNFNIFILSLISLFNLIKILGNKKNSHAPNLYRVLITAFSNLQSNDERKITFICQNMITMIKQIKNLPGGVLVSTIIKHLSTNPNIYLIQLCKVLLQQKRVDQQQSVELLEILTKIIFQDTVHGEMVIDIVFQYIPSLNDEVADDYLLNNCKLILSNFVSSCKTITKSYKELNSQFQYNSKNYSEEQNVKKNEKLLVEVKKLLLCKNYVYFLNKYIDIDDINLKNSLQTVIFHTYIKVKVQLKKKKVADLLMPILKRYYDNDDDLDNQITQYEKETYPEQDSKEYSSKITLLKSIRLNKSMDLSMQNSLQLKTIDPSTLKPSTFALKDLQTLKQKKQHLKTIQLTKQKQSLDSQIKLKQIKNLMNQKRMIQFGSAGKTDFQYKNLYEFDTMKQEEIISGVPMIKLINFEKQQEQTYEDDLKNIMKKYRKVWRFLFFKYSTFGAKKQEFKTQEKIHMSQIWKMIRQYELFSFLKKEQSQTIIKLINDVMKRKNDPQNLTYPGFQEYIAQLCCYSYSKVDYSHIPSGRQVLLFIQHLKKQTKQKGGSIQLFENPEDVYFQQTDVIREYNKRLKQNPDYILPQGYKKYKQTNLQYEYNIHPMLQKNISQSYIQVYEVLHEILFSQLQISLVQPLSIKTQVTLAKPMLFQNIAEKMKDYKKGYLQNKTTIEVKDQKQKQLKKSIVVSKQFKPHINFSLGIKLGMGAVSIKNRSIAQQVAYWMHDMLNAVQRQSLKVEPKKKAQNTLIRRRRVESLQKLKKQRSQKKQWKKRAQSVKAKLQLQKKAKQQQNIKKKQLQVQQKRKKRARQQQALRKKLSRFQQMKKIMGQKKQQIKYRKIEQQDKRKQRLQSYRQKVAQYFQKKKQQILQKQQALKQKKQQEQKQKQQKRQKQQKFKKQLYLSNLKKQQNVIQKADQLKQQYEELWESEQIQKQFKKHQKELQYLFNLLLKHQKSKISATNYDQIGLNTLHYFALKFMIVPFMIEKNQLIYIFNFVIKDKEKKSLEESNEKQSPQKVLSSPAKLKHPGLNFKDFQQALFLIVVKAKKLLNKIKDKRQKRMQKLMQFLKEKKAQNGQNHFDVEDMSTSSQEQSDQQDQQEQKPPGLLQNYLYNVDDVDQDTLQQIFVFLKLPKDKVGVQQRYRAVIQSKNLKPKNLLKVQLRKQLQTVTLEDVQNKQQSDQED